MIATATKAAPDQGASPQVALEPLSIAAVRDQTGLTARAIRHYHQVGLIDCPRDKHGARTFDAISVARLEVIRDLRLAGVALPRVADILFGEGDLAMAVCAELRLQARRFEEDHGRARRLLARWEGTPDPMTFLLTSIP